MWQTDEVRKAGSKSDRGHCVCRAAVQADHLIHRAPEPLGHLVEVITVTQRNFMRADGFFRIFERRWNFDGLEPLHHRFTIARIEMHRQAVE